MAGKAEHGPTKDEVHREQVRLCVKDLKPLIDRYGSTSVIYGALRSIAVQAKKREQLVELRKKVAELEQEVK